MSATVDSATLFEGDTASQLIYDTLIDRGYGHDRELVLERMRGYDGDFWLDFFGPMLDRVEEALCIGYCAKCDQPGCDTTATGPDGLTICDRCRDA